jgi:hypothetical protein
LQPGSEVYQCWHTVESNHGSLLRVRVICITHLTAPRSKPPQAISVRIPVSGSVNMKAPHLVLSILSALGRLPWIEAVLPVWSITVSLAYRCAIRQAASRQSGVICKAQLPAPFRPPPCKMPCVHSSQHRRTTLMLPTAQWVSISQLGWHIPLRMNSPQMTKLLCPRTVQSRARKQHHQHSPVQVSMWIKYSRCFCH